MVALYSMHAIAMCEPKFTAIVTYIRRVRIQGAKGASAHALSVVSNVNCTWKPKLN